MAFTQTTGTSLVGTPRRQCPCENFTALSKILETLDSPQAMRSLLDWLDGRTDDLALQHNQLLSCGKRSRCRFRYGTSFAILNAIRDACRPYLELEATTTESYEEAFPPLQPSTTAPGTTKATTTTTTTTTTKQLKKPHPAAFNILVPPKKMTEKTIQEESDQLQIKQKRRIQPAQVDSVSRFNSVWNTAPTHVWGNGNLENLSQVPLLSSKKTSAFSPIVSNPTKLVQYVPTPVITSMTQKKTPHHQLENLATVYVALFRNLLVPSTPLELHLLIRLLMLEGNSRATDSVLHFHSVLSNPESCQQFAILALSKLKPLLRTLPISLLQSIVQCEPFQKHCAELAQEFSLVLLDYKVQGLLIDYPTEAVTGTHAIFSLPFDHERDSRHNYKTPVEAAVYKNRETIRDAFLSALRNFVNTKGSLHERAQERLRLASKEIYDQLMNVNGAWFAQFFCELLLQVGLSPLQETDQELLNIADKDKLQKLHKRLSSRSAQTSKSSKKISLSQNSTVHSSTSVDEARVQFPGYQEFFFLVLCEVPFNIGIHLRGHLAKIILDLQSNLSSSELEKRIMKLLVIARFLGYLVFSPNWHETGFDAGKNQSLILTNGLQQLESLGVFLISHVHDAWSKGQVIATIPWVTELLRMVKWDSWTQTSIQFRQLLASLRGIQKILATTSIQMHTRFGPSMEIVSFYLERFFDETISLPRLTSLPQSKLDAVKVEQSECLDDLSSGFSTVFLYASSPHMEDLFSLVNQKGRGVANKSPSKARKLRPSIVSISTGIEPTKLFGESDKGLFPVPVNATTETQKKESRTIETKLAEAFFHQHRDIKEVCEFAVDRTLKGIPNHAVTQCIQKTFEENGLTEASTDEMLTKAQLLALDRAKVCLESQLEDTVKRGLKVFVPGNVHPRVLSVATSLSVSRGLLAGQLILHNIILQASKSWHQKEQTVEQKEKLSVSIEMDDTNVVVGAIQNLANLFDGSSNQAAIPDFTQVLANIDRATVCIQNHRANVELSIPSESSLRRIVIALRRLDQRSGSIITWYQALGDDEFHCGLLALLRLTMAVSTISTLGLKQLNSKVSCSMIMRLLASSFNPKGGKKEVVQLLKEAVEENIISLETLTDAANMHVTDGEACTVLAEILDHVQR